MERDPTLLLASLCSSHDDFFHGVQAVLGTFVVREEGGGKRVKRRRGG